MFAVKLLPDHCAVSYIEKIPHTSAQLAAALDYRFSYDELREIVQEADVVLSALGIVYGATRGELSWREIGQTEVGVRAALSWLDLAFFDGRPMRTALDSLRQHLLASPDWRTPSSPSSSSSRPRTRRRRSRCTSTRRVEA